jgi:hypothetical protein
MHANLQRIAISTIIAFTAIMSSATISHSQNWQPMGTSRSIAECEAKMQALLRSGRIRAYKCVPMYRYARQKPQQSGRLSKGTKVMDRNLRKAGVAVPKGWQRNHLIPDEIVRSHPLMIEARRRNLYNLDRASNILPMPSTAKARKANPRLIGHQGSHNGYNNLINNNLELVKQILVRRYDSLSKVPNIVLIRAIERVENNARIRILEHNIPLRFNPKTGTRIISDAGSAEEELVTVIIPQRSSVLNL